MSVQARRLGHGLRLARVARLDILWAVFVGLNELLVPATPAVAAGHSAKD
jgi:hypothetical protein